VCGGFDRCWSHDSSAVNASLCYFPCTASTSSFVESSSPRPWLSSELCATQRDLAPSVDRRVVRRLPATPRISQDVTATPLVAAASTASRPRGLPLLCLIGVGALLAIAAAVVDGLRNYCKLSRVHDGDFTTSRRRRDAGEFRRLPVVNSVVVDVCRRFDATVCDCTRSRTSASSFRRRRRRKLASRTTLS